MTLPVATAPAPYPAPTPFQPPEAPPDTPPAPTPLPAPPSTHFRSTVQSPRTPPHAPTAPPSDLPALLAPSPARGGEGRGAGRPAAAPRLSGGHRVRRPQPGADAPQDDVLPSQAPHRPGLPSRPGMSRAPAGALRAALYDWECEHVAGRRDQDLGFYAGLASSPGTRILELACGTGRVGVPPAARVPRATVVGLDP